jgi:hypothetical protein
LGNNVVGADCVEFKPVENPKVLCEAGSPALSGAWEEVTIVTPMLGIFQFRSKDMRIHTIHRWSGRITIMLILLTIIAGIQMVLTVLAYDVMSMPIK